MAALTVRRALWGAAAIDGALDKVEFAGTVPAPVAASGGGDTFVNDGYTWFRVINGGGGAINVTFTKPGIESDGSSLDPCIELTAGQTKEIGPFKKDMFDDANGSVAVSYSGVTSVTVEAVSYAR